MSTESLLRTPDPRALTLVLLVCAGPARAEVQPHSTTPPTPEVYRMTLPDGAEGCGVRGRGRSCRAGCYPGQTAVCLVGENGGAPVCRCNGEPKPGAVEQAKRRWEQVNQARKEAGQAREKLPPELAVEPGGATEEGGLPEKPLEAPVARSIGPEGGSVTSVDGLFTVELPPGALKEPTQISVQRLQAQGEPITYQVEPDGLPLKKKGKVILRKPRGEGGQGMVAAPITQDKDGRWVQRGAMVDTAAGTKTVEIDHL